MKLKKILEEAIRDSSLSTPKYPKEILNIKSFLYHKFPSRSIVSITPTGNGSYNLYYPFDSNSKIQLIANESGDILDGYADFSQQYMDRNFSNDKIYKYKRGIGLFNWIKKEYLKYKQSPNYAVDNNPESNYSSTDKFETQGIIPPKVEQIKKALEAKYNRRFWINSNIEDGFLISDMPNSERVGEYGKFHYHKKVGLPDSLFVVVNADGMFVRGHRYEVYKKDFDELDMDGNVDANGKYFAYQMSNFLRNI